MATKLKIIISCIILLVSCTASGPQETLNNLAKSLENNDPSTFLAQIDMKAFAANHIKNMTENDTALSSLNALGNALGLGSLDDLLGNLVDMQSRLEQQYERGVASGELIIECRDAETPTCPWVPASLRNAQIVELGPDAAIAKVTTPAKLTSWLAMHKIGEKWQVVGQAVLESRARSYATQSITQPQSQQQPKQSPKSQPKSSKQGAVEI